MWAGPRTEVVHQVQNQWICDTTQPEGGCSSAIRIGEMKLIIGGPGDSRTVEKPAACIPTPPVPDGYKAPCPQRGFLAGCVVACGSKSHNCAECYGNVTPPVGQSHLFQNGATLTCVVSPMLRMVLNILT